MSREGQRVGDTGGAGWLSIRQFGRDGSEECDDDGRSAKLPVDGSDSLERNCNCECSN